MVVESKEEDSDILECGVPSYDRRAGRQATVAKGPHVL